MFTCVHSALGRRKARGESLELVEVRRPPLGVSSDGFAEEFRSVRVARTAFAASRGLVLHKVAIIEVEDFQQGLNLGVVLHRAPTRDDGSRVRTFYLDDTTAGMHAIGRSAEPVVHVMYFESEFQACLLYTSPSPRDQRGSRMPSSA